LANSTKNYLENRLIIFYPSLLPDRGFISQQHPARVAGDPALVPIVDVPISLRVKQRELDFTAKHIGHSHISVDAPADFDLTAIGKKSALDLNFLKRY
jgi:hypothetical protein